MSEIIKDVGLQSGNVLKQYDDGDVIILDGIHVNFVHFKKDEIKELIEELQKLI